MFFEALVQGFFGYPHLFVLLLQQGVQSSLVLTQVFFEKTQFFPLLIKSQFQLLIDSLVDRRQEDVVVEFLLHLLELCFEWCNQSAIDSNHRFEVRLVAARNASEILEAAVGFVKFLNYGEGEPQEFLILEEIDVGGEEEDGGKYAVKAVLVQVESTL